MRATARNVQQVQSKRKTVTSALPIAKSAVMKVHVVNARRYYFFKPSAPSTASSSKAPVAGSLLVMLHGCQQTALDISACTGLNRLAAQVGFMVLYPEQDRLAHGQGCWNWYGGRSGRSVREAVSILGAIDDACSRYAVDPGRIVIAGFSAGASMAAVVALHQPARFAAVAMHSGVNPELADTAASAWAAMRGNPRKVKHPPAVPQPLLPPLLVLQGSEDNIVVKTNGIRVAASWAAYRQAQAGAPRVTRRGNRYPATSMDWAQRGRLVATLTEISGLGHAWSGGRRSQPFADPQGPDASRLIWAFAEREFARAAKRALGE